ncbi:MAG: asparagine synthase (glutamine-hydrolyzing) [Verrucomicrobiae bacterium]|nr:asparagine synthase (glutamine-hydrolyzing) [Verrucomicrobiae bacterium]
MCAIAGILNLAAGAAPSERALRRMLGMMRHRGPDQFGIFLGDQVALGNARLSIVDLAGGQQPIGNEDGNLWIVFNGEIFNHLELRTDLERNGHRFTTHCDTEVVLHLYEEYGADCLRKLNGQFAVAIWNQRDRSLFLARDRVGIRPLFYTCTPERLLFASEIKAILADPQIDAQMDPVSVDQIFTYWSPLSPRTCFRDIFELAPGCYLKVQDGRIVKQAFWRPEYDQDTAVRLAARRRSVADYVEEFHELLRDAVRVRLRADVAVGAYLSGGLDSSTITALVRKLGISQLDTFSIAFDDEKFDESQFQLEMADYLGTQHHVVRATHAEIGNALPDVVWHTEVPILRTSPVPMFLLSKLVHERGFKVVLTGEGADEFLGGYDIFKEAKIRRFWARQPTSKWRSALLKRLYPDLNLAGAGGSYLAAFFGSDLAKTNAPDFSHHIRWRNTHRAARFFSQDFTALVTEARKREAPLIDYPAGFENWGDLEQAQYLEISTFLSAYLLSAQGDRVAMAHSVEGRYPFLDVRVMEFCNRLPARLKLRALTEKYLLRQLASQYLPEAIWKRRKRPYRAPIHRSFFHAATPDYVRELLSDSHVRASGIFNPLAVRQLATKLEQGKPVGETDDMALAGILSTLLVQKQFVTGFRVRAELSAHDDVKVVRHQRREAVPLGAMPC